MAKVRFTGLWVGAKTLFGRKALPAVQPRLNRAAGLQNPTSVSIPLAADPEPPLPRFLEDSQPSPDPIRQGTAYVGSGCRIRGDLFFQGSIRIDGEVDGTISARRCISVGESGAITTAAPITAAEIMIAGRVEGNVVASERIGISGSATILGDLIAPIIAIQAGAAVEGRCSTMPHQKVPAVEAGSGLSNSRLRTTKPSRLPVINRSDP